jgi:hypothetical protein
MASSKTKRLTRKVKSLKPASLSGKKAKSVKGGYAPSPIRMGKI